MRILIIEDEFNLADVVASRLKKEKYAVDIFCNGEEGLENALTDIYDINNIRCNVTQKKWI